MPSKSLKRVQIWSPNLFNFKGGIQVYSGYLLQAFGQICPETDCDVFLLHDKSQDPEFLCSDKTKFYFSGGWPAPVRNLAFAVRLTIQAICQRPDLIITTHLNFTPVAYQLKRLLGIPYWTTAHGVEAWDVQRPGLRRALQNADRILAVSNYTRDRLLKEQDLHPDKVSVLPNTVDTQRFTIAEKPAYLLERYGLKAEQPVILTVCRLCSTETYKGYEKIIEAIPHIQKVIPDVHYLIAGKGDDRSHLEQLIARSGLQACVTLAGFVPDAELCAYYQLCDVFAMPSKLEGFGIVYLEAIACGKPAIGGNQDGAIDALCHGELGVLVDPDDARAIATGITDIILKTYPNPLLYEPKGLRNQMIKAYGLERFQSNLSEQIAEEVV